ncbi:MAG: S8/S53 family peptidase [Planctomycetota bacterium]
MYRPSLRNRPLVVALCAFLSPSLIAQETDRRPVEPVGVENGVDYSVVAPHLVAPDGPMAGRLTATERWIVLFKPSGVDVDALRDARELELGLGARRQLIEQIEAETLAWHQPVVELVEGLGGVVRGHLWIVDSMEIEATKELLDRLRSHPRVRDLRPNAAHAPGATSAIEAIRSGEWKPAPIETSIDRNHHNAVTVHQTGNRGQGETIAFIDTQFDDGEVTPLELPNSTFFPGGDPSNTNGPGVFGSRLSTVSVSSFSLPENEIHGTFVAAIAAGEAWNSDPEASPGHAPGANIVGYECAENAEGFASSFSLAAAWQAILSRRVLGSSTRIACVGYEGLCLQSNSIDQQAMDRAIRLGDVVGVAISGNGQGTGADCRRNWAYNGLIVGYVSNFDRLKASDSPFDDGVLGPTLRLFPHLVASGVDLSGPFANSDLTAFNASGSSFAAPQVAGAVALFFSAAPARSGLEARAAVLASSEDIRMVNRTADRDALGAGYLRDDRLVDLANGQGLLARGTLTAPGSSRSYTVGGTPGEQLSVALVWDRQNDLQAVPTGAAMAVRVRNGSSVLATSPLYSTCAQHLRLTMPASGSVSVDVILVALEPGGTDVRFGVAAITAPEMLVTGTITEFGSSCGPNRFVVQQPAMVGDQHGVFPEFVVNPPSLPVLILGSQASSIAVGSNGCTLLVAPSVSAPISGTSITRIPVPPISSLVGGTLYEQLLILDAQRPDGFYLTEAAVLTVGGVR